MKKATNRKSGYQLVAAWVPVDMVQRIDDWTKREDTDRSKWMRDALRRKLESCGFPVGVDPSQTKRPASRRGAGAIAIAAILALFALSANAPVTDQDEAFTNRAVATSVD